MLMDNSDVIGVSKSLRIRIKEDVMKPLRVSITLNIKQGVMEFPIKYEKLPVFYYICAVLGYGKKDYDEVTVHRKFSEKLRVSTLGRIIKGVWSWKERRT
ncbi:Bifunctional alpha-galactosidase/sucrose kinase AgaSK [Bienertia sinuspersici]